jgi:hypothetical protein
MIGYSGSKNIQNILTQTRASSGVVILKQAGKDNDYNSNNIKNQRVIVNLKNH